MLRWRTWSAEGADPWVVEVLWEGYYIPFWNALTLSREPIPFTAYCPNTIRGKALTQEVESLLQKGAIELAPLPSLGYYSRLFVVMKASVSWRPVIDLSLLNLKVLKTPFKMETLQSVLLSVRRGDWMVSIDLMDAYLQVPMHPESRKFLRFMAFGKVYQFKVLRFGLSTAPQVFMLVMAPVSAILHSLGIRLRHYLDDWLIQASSREQVLLALRTVLRLCNSLGIVVSWEKSQLVPTQKIFLGVLLDSVSFRASPAQKRVDKLLSIGDVFLSRENQPARSWLELLGVLSSMTQLIPGGTAEDAVVPVCASSHLRSLGSQSSCAVVSREPSGSSLVVRPRTARVRNLSRAGGSPARLVVRRVRCRLGGASRQESSFWPLVSRGAAQLHKPSGVVSDLLGAPAFSASGSEFHSSSLCRQYDSVGLPAESGQLQVCSFESDSAGSPTLGGAPFDLPSASVCYGMQQRVGRLSLLSTSGSGFRVDPETVSVSTTSEKMAGVDRPVCNLSKSPLLTLFFSVPRSQCSWDGCSSPTVGWVAGV